MSMNTITNESYFMDMVVVDVVDDVDNDEQDMMICLFYDLN